MQKKYIFTAIPYQLAFAKTLRGSLHRSGHAVYLYNTHEHGTEMGMVELHDTVIEECIAVQRSGQLLSHLCHTLPASLWIDKK